MPRSLQVFTAEKAAEWNAILKNQGVEATADRIKGDLGVVFKPSEVRGFCDFYASPAGKHISAQMPRVMKRLEESTRDFGQDTERRLQALAVDYQERIAAAASAK
jgi:hypothetical protein